MSNILSWIIKYTIIFWNSSYNENRSKFFPYSNSWCYRTLFKSQSSELFFFLNFRMKKNDASMTNTIYINGPTKNELEAWNHMLLRRIAVKFCVSCIIFCLIPIKLQPTLRKTAKGTTIIFYMWIFTSKKNMFNMFVCKHDVGISGETIPNVNLFISPRNYREERNCSFFHSDTPT